MTAINDFTRGHAKDKFLRVWNHERWHEYLSTVSEIIAVISSQRDAGLGSLGTQRLDHFFGSVCRNCDCDDMMGILSARFSIGSQKR
jgi:hypothetical protein